MSIGIEEETFPPRYNRYRCGICEQSYLTVELAAGTTPMFMTCFRTEGCGGVASSMMYRGVGMGVPLLIEFVKPSPEDLERIKHPGLLQHFRKGGLMRRACDTAPEWVKGLA